MAQGSIEKLMDINSRLDHLESSAEWIAKETVHSDSAVSHTGTLIMVLVDDLRERLCSLVKELEQISEDSTPIQ